MNKRTIAEQDQLIGQLVNALVAVMDSALDDIGEASWEEGRVALEASVGKERAEELCPLSWHFADRDRLREKS